MLWINLILFCVYFCCFYPAFGIKSIVRASNKLLIWEYKKVSLFVALYKVATENNTKFTHETRY